MGKIYWKTFYARIAFREVVGVNRKVKIPLYNFFLQISQSWRFTEMWCKTRWFNHWCGDQEITTYFVYHISLKEMIHWAGRLTSFLSPINFGYTFYLTWLIVQPKASWNISLEGYATHKWNKPWSFRVV